MVHQHTCVTGHVDIELWLGIDVLFYSIFVSPDELIFKTQESE